MGVRSGHERFYPDFQPATEDQPERLFGLPITFSSDPAMTGQLVLRVAPPEHLPVPMWAVNLLHDKGLCPGCGALVRFTPARFLNEPGIEVNRSAVGCPQCGAVGEVFSTREQGPTVYELGSDAAEQFIRDALDRRDQRIKAATPP